MSERVKQLKKLKKEDLFMLVMAYEDEIQKLEEQLQKKTIVIQGADPEDFMHKYLRDRIRVVQNPEKRAVYEQSLERLL